MSFFFSSLFLSLFFLFPSSSLSANPIKIPIIKNALNVHTRPFAKIPDQSGRTAGIVCLVSRGKYLYVCTLRKIYRVSSSGKQVDEWIDLDRAFREKTGRRLNTDSFQHGGLRSLAFHPNFKSNRKFYVTAMEDRPSNPAAFKYVSDVDQCNSCDPPRKPISADSVLVEFECEQNSDKPIFNSYRLVFRVGMPVFDHPIKQIAFFGRNLYIAHGDGSEQSATVGGGQNKDALGKILRISPLQRGNKPYTVPRSNPFVKNRKYPNEVYAVGFRNPHHICFAGDGTLFAAESGRDNIEEVNIVKPGLNYGWSEREGTFLHKKTKQGENSGLISGIGALPSDDAKKGYEYPVVQVGHEGDIGAGFVGQAIAGGCPVQNGSPMSGLYFYSDFPITGNLYFSRIEEMKLAVTKGRPSKLTQARTRQAVIWFDHDNNPRTPPRKYQNLGDAMRSESAYRNEDRVDVRFGRGPRGELYWTSKRSGRVYLFTSSLPRGPGGVPKMRSARWLNVSEDIDTELDAEWTI